MAVILIMQEIVKNVIDIELSLAPSQHELILSWNVNDALAVLRQRNIDMVICAVHLQSGCVFDLLRFVKVDPVRRQTKFVFFCQDPGEIARFVNSSVKATAMILGADKYIVTTKFDADRFRAEIDSLFSAGGPENTEMLCWQLQEIARQALEECRFSAAERLLKKALALMEGDSFTYDPAQIAQLHTDLSSIYKAEASFQDGTQG